MKNRIIILSGPSQVGKDAIVKELLKYEDLNLSHVVTYTSREKRPEEVEGVDHYFVSEKKFREMVDKDLFLEWIPVRNRLFGTPKSGVDKLVKEGKNVLLKIEVRGAAKVMEQLDDILTIFIMPDSVEVLKKRMKRKGFSDEQLRIRWQETQNELKAGEKYQYKVINYEGKLQETVEKVRDIIKKEIK